MLCFPWPADSWISHRKSKKFLDLGTATLALVPHKHGFADYESLGIPSFSINSYSVGRLTPSSTAAEVIFPR